MDAKALNKLAYEITNRFDLRTLKQIQQFNNNGSIIAILPPIKEISDLLSNGQDMEANALAKEIKEEVDCLELYGTKEDMRDSNWP